MVKCYNLTDVYKTIMCTDGPSSTELSSHSMLIIAKFSDNFWGKVHCATNEEPLAQMSSFIYHGHTQPMSPMLDHSVSTVSTPQQLCDDPPWLIIKFNLLFKLQFANCWFESKCTKNHNGWSCSTWSIKSFINIWKSHLNVYCINSNNLLRLIF